MECINGDKLAYSGLSWCGCGSPHVEPQQGPANKIVNAKMGNAVSKSFVSVLKEPPDATTLAWMSSQTKPTAGAVGRLAQQVRLAKVVSVFALMIRCSAVELVWTSKPTQATAETAVSPAKQEKSAPKVVASPTAQASPLMPVEMPA